VDRDTKHYSLTTNHFKNMKAESINIFWDFFNPTGLFGPILDKELRVSSRRKRNYLLRSTYIVLLGLFILSFWISTITLRNTNPATFQASRSAMIGKQITIMIIWFQFIVSQLIAMVMLSSSISDEIRAGTLGVLMTTPVNSVQIIIGKFVSKLLQVFLLVAISFPLLSIIRVLGGVPWSFIVFSLLITFTSVIFAGSFSLFLSVFNRNVYRVILLEMIIFFIIFGIVPFIIISLGAAAITLNSILALINPFWALYVAAQMMSISSIHNNFWLIHCLIFLSLSGIFLGISIWKIRSAALNNVSYKHKHIESKRIIKDEKGNEIAHYYDNSGPIKRVGNNPIVWKENYGGMFGKGKTDKIVTISTYLLGIGGILFLLISKNIAPLLVSIIMMFINLVLIMRLAISTAGSISSEKEARTLPILLVTPLKEKDIIFGKVKVGIWRNLSIIILHYLMFTSLYTSYCLRGMMKFSQIKYQIPASIISIAAMILLVVSCGSYIGVRMKNPRAAIATTIGAFIVITLLVEMLNPMRLFMMFTTIQFASNPSIYEILNIISSIVSLCIFSGISWYCLRNSIRKLRHNIF